MWTKIQFNCFKTVGNFIMKIWPQRFHHTFARLVLSVQSAEFRPSCREIRRRRVNGTRSAWNASSALADNKTTVCVGFHSFLTTRISRTKAVQYSLLAAMEKALKYRAINVMASTRLRIYSLLPAWTYDVMMHTNSVCDVTCCTWKIQRNSFFPGVDQHTALWMANHWKLSNYSFAAPRWRNVHKPVRPRAGLQSF